MLHLPHLNRIRLSGLQWSTIKKHPHVVPLFIYMGLSLSFGIFTMIRTAIKSPDVMINRKKNPEPWNEYAHKQYKLFKTTKDYPDCPAPDY